MAEAEKEMSKTEQIQARWNQLAGWYSKTVSVPLMSVGVQICTALNVGPEPNILEVACGDGRLADRMRDMHPKMKYTGIDLSESMVNLAKERCPDYSFEVGDAENLKYEDNTFDAYLSSLCLQIVGDPTKMMAEAYRVLKPGGVAGFSIWGPKETSSFWNCIEKATKSINEELGSLSNFHLSNNDFAELKQVIKDAKVGKTVRTNGEVAFPIFSGDDFANFWPKKDDDEAKLKKYRDTLSQSAEEVLDSGKPICFAVTYVFFKKPS